MKLTRHLDFHPLLFHVLPLVNVLFLVFMLYAMSSRFVLQPGIAVALPLSSFTLGPQDNPEIVSVTAAPAAAVYHRDAKVTPAELGERLRASPAKQRALVIKADRNTPHELVVQILNEGLKHGFSVVLATDPGRQ